MVQLVLDRIVGEELAVIQRVRQRGDGSAKDSDGPECELRRLPCGQISESENVLKGPEAKRRIRNCDVLRSARANTEFGEIGRARIAEDRGIVCRGTDIVDCDCVSE